VALGFQFPPADYFQRREMKKIKIILGLAALYVLVSAGWQIGACEIANIELKDDMRDIASQIGLRIGYSDVATDDDLRETILRKAEKYNIALSPDQVTVLRDGYGKNANIYLAAEYTVPIYLPHYTFSIYFNPRSANKPPVSAMANDSRSSR
jgi:hypothetical protein